MKGTSTVSSAAVDGFLRLASPLGALALVLPLGACLLTPSPAAARIREADDRIVAGCEFLGEVYGTDPGITELARENARTRALEQAAAKRATHVVWDSFASDHATSVSGKAYRCGGNDAPVKRP